MQESTKPRELHNGEALTVRVNGLSSLTPRQQEIARLLSNTGLSYKEVASHLAISEGTMRKHVENVYRRVGVRSRAELMIALLAPVV